MSKDPAFLFYTSDFLTGISDLTMEERGQYISLLCLQHQKGHLTKKMIDLCVGNAAADVMAKFRQDKNGMWYNVRLDKEIEKRAEHSAKQKKRALDGWEKRREKDKNKHDATAHATALPLENEDVNENVIEDRDKGKGVGKPLRWEDDLIYPFDSDLFKTNWKAHREMREAKHKEYLTRDSEQASLMAISRLTKNETEAIEIIQQSLANGWQDFFKLKTDGKQQTTIDRRDQSKQDTSDAVARHYAERLASEKGGAGI